jgi:L-2-hydroxyglutarate oxidase LhgO
VTFISKTQHADVVLIGGGIMSATLGAFIKQLEPNWTVSLFERLDEAGLESSGPWNNAGTGHAALCELNYSPAAKDGSVDPAKALHINEQYQLSRQFWSHLVDELPDRLPQGLHQHRSAHELRHRRRPHHLPPGPATTRSRTDTRCSGAMEYSEDHSRRSPSGPR